MTLVAGVDSSTQSCKVVVVDAETGAIVREGRAPHPDGTSVDPTAWWDALLAAIADAGGLDDVAAIAVAGQQHGMVALDADGRVVRDALLWNDTRSAAAAAALVDEVGADEYALRTGVVPVASFTATKLRWLRDHEPENAARVAAVCLPHDWLTWRLRGYGPAGESPLGSDLDALTTDRSDASGTAYWSPTTGQYDLELLERALGRRVRVPRVLEPLEAAGATGATGLAAGIPIGAGAGDNAAAALGLGASAGDVVISLGTSGTVFAVTPAVVPSIAECARLGFPVLAGALTPTEACTAMEQGALAVKLFPASVGGPSYLTAVRDPFPTIPFFAVGGVGLEQVAQYAAAGAVGLGLGGPLIGNAASGGSIERLRERARRFRDASADWRS